MLLLTAFIGCDAADRESLIAAAIECAAKTREEDGCLEYRFYEDTEATGRFVFVERWRDRACLDAHLSSPHLSSFVEVSGPLLTDRRGVLYDVDAGTEL